VLVSHVIVTIISYTVEVRPHFVRIRSRLEVILKRILTEYDASTKTGIISLRLHISGEIL